MKPLVIQQAPDFSPDNPYQPLLNKALNEIGVQTPLLSDYRRILPLSRGRHESSVGLHLHWPEAYWRGSGLMGLARRWRFPFDLNRALQGRPLFVTAHNLLPHSGASRKAAKNYEEFFRKAERVFVHSIAAGKNLEEVHGISSDKRVVIPFGDHSAHLAPTPSKAEARETLGLEDKERIALHFGAISRYKGSEELMQTWPSTNDSPTLLVAGGIVDEGLASSLETIAAQNPRIDFRPNRVSDELLPTFFAASDAALFNYRRIFSSGAACLARSFGLPVLLPEHCDTVDLGEPDQAVFRFKHVGDKGFRTAIEAACELSRSQDRAEQWRALTSWEKVAEITAETYRAVCPQ